VDKVGGFIEKIESLFSTVDDGTQQVAETVANKEDSKKAVVQMAKIKNDTDLFTFFNVTEKVVGKKGINAVMDNVEKQAAEQDKIEHTSRYTSLYKSAKAKYEQQNVIPVPNPATAPDSGIKNQSNSYGQMQGDAITDGGKKSVIINIGKFFDNMNLTAQTMQQGLDDFEQRVENIFLRIVNSAG